MTAKTAISLLFVLLSTALHAQVNKATRLFDQGAYSEAGRLYEKVLEKDASNWLAINNLAHCYRMEKRYDLAKQYFEKTLGFSDPASSNHYHYAEMHYLLGQYDTATTHLQKYLLAVPSDTAASGLLQRIKAVKQFNTTADFELVTLRGINSPFADFSPVVHNAGLVFTTERKSDTGSEEFAIELKPFTNLYYAPFSNDRQTSFWTPSPFSKQLSSPFHDGPACFSQSGNEVFFTQVRRDYRGKDRLNTMKIFVSHREGDQWSSPAAMPFNSDEWSVGHPCLALNDSVLIFSSNMPGTAGGMDLFMCRRAAAGWTAPVSAGSGVNSSGNEVFPHVHGTYLYFSSDGHHGYGGLDLFRIHLDSLDTAPQNLFAPVNSAWDDVSITFVNDHKAYFSSDRPGGMGRDDIYGLERIAPPEVHREISGILEYDNQPAAQTDLLLSDPEGKLLQRATTNHLGKFTLNYLHSGVPYVITIDASDPATLPRYSVFLLNAQQQKVKQINAGDDGSFRFELLPPDDHDNLELLDVADVSLLSVDIRGQFFDSEPGDLGERIEILLVDENGQVLSRTTTRRNGQFLFRHLFPDDQYIFRLLADNPKLKMAILNEDGEVSEVILRENGQYIYRRIKPGEEVLTLTDEADRTMRITPNDQFSIPNIYYDLDAWQLNDAARKQLQRLAGILERNTAVKAHIMSHTDSRASDGYNQRLSERRAEEVVRYLQTLGIGRERLRYSGYGESRLINHCRSGVPCSEDEHARNRRTEFALEAAD